MTNTWKLYESMCEARAEVAAEAAEDRPAEEVLAQMAEDSEARWDFTPYEALEEQEAYLRQFEGWFNV